MDETVKCECCTAVMRAPQISAFRRLLTGMGRWVRQRRHSKPGRASPIRRSLDPAGDSGRRQALARLRDCYSLARGLVSPTEWNANLEWILGPKKDPNAYAAGFDKKTVDAVVLWLEDLAAAVNRTPVEPSKDPLEGARPDHQARQSIARGLRDATEGFAVAFRHPTPATGWSARF